MALRPGSEQKFLAPYANTNQPSVRSGTSAAKSRGERSPAVRTHEVNAMIMRARAQESSGSRPNENSRKKT